MSVVIVEEGEGLALTLQLEKLQKEWEEKKTQSVEVRKVLDDLKLHKLRMKRLAEELSVAEAWEIELEARRLRVEESLKPPLLGLFDKLESEDFVGDQLLREAFVSDGEDVFKTLESRASKVRQLERRALLMFVHLLLRLRLMLNEDIGLGRVEKLAKVVVQELARPDIVWSCLDKEEVRIVMMVTQELDGLPHFLVRVVNQLLAGAARRRGVEVGVQTEDMP